MSYLNQRIDANEELTLIYIICYGIDSFTNVYNAYISPLISLYVWFYINHLTFSTSLL